MNINNDPTKSLFPKVPRIFPRSWVCTMFKKAPNKH